ncbi:MAG: hypothetical protein HGA37_16130 [Lentimicrobium sp.]|nr:hypothetical protein [Lentimicrobium sp.]
MKKITFIALSLVMTTMVFGQKATKLNIVYFHAQHRCPTCLSIEENTKKTLDTYFAAQLKDGTIKLQVLDVSEEKNEKLVVKYEADGSGLYLTRLDGKKETTTDFTNFAFSYSRNQADKFIEGLKAEIEKNLK